MSSAGDWKRDGLCEVPVLAAARDRVITVCIKVAPRDAQRKAGVHDRARARHTRPSHAGRARRHGRAIDGAVSRDRRGGAQVCWLRHAAARRSRGQPRHSLPAETHRPCPPPFLSPAWAGTSDAGCCHCRFRPASSPRASRRRRCGPGQPLRSIQWVLPNKIRPPVPPRHGGPPRRHRPKLRRHPTRSPHAVRLARSISLNRARR